jgi:putative ABC transport system ATP-binding protein
MRDTILTVEHLTMRYASPGGSLTVLDDINFAVTRPAAVAIVGASGSGKSTLLALLAGLELPTAGRVVLAGHDLGALDEDGRARIRRDHVGFVFQQFHLLPAFTALENVMLPLELTGAAEARERAAATLTAVGLGARLSHYPRQLSGGEQQRVALARAYCTRPALLLADEPTGNLDTANGRLVLDLLLAMNREEDTTMVLVTHEQELAASADRRILLRDGRIVSE